MGKHDPTAVSLKDRYTNFIIDDFITRNGTPKKLENLHRPKSKLT